MLDMKKVFENLRENVKNHPVKIPLFNITYNKIV